MKWKMKMRKWWEESVARDEDGEEEEGDEEEERVRKRMKRKKWEEIAMAEEGWMDEIEKPGTWTPTAPPLPDAARVAEAAEDREA